MVVRYYLGSALWIWGVISLWFGVVQESSHQSDVYKLFSRE